MKKYLLFAFPLILVLIINVYVRTYSVNFPQLKRKAKELVEQSLRQQATQDIYAKFPQFNPLAKEKLIKNQLTLYKKHNKQSINKQINELHNKLKDRYQDDKGQTYLMELDCWHWARYVDNVIKYGHPGDEVIYGAQWDRLMLAPNGFYMLWDQLLFYLSAFLYRFFSAFNSVQLFTFLFYLPLFFAIVFIVVLYLFSYRLGNHLGAIISCLFIGLAPIFLRRSHAGWFDRDVLNLMFPLLVTWTYVLASCSPSLTKRILWIAFSSFWVSLFCFNWTFWWFIFFIIVIFEGFYLVYLVYINIRYKNKELDSLKQHLLSLFLFFAFSLAWILMIVGPHPLVKLYDQIKLAPMINKPLMGSIWPNVYSTVGEMRSLGLREIAKTSAGNLIFVFSISCLLILLIRALFSRGSSLFKRNSVIILSIWFLAMFFASWRGIRFVVFLLLPLGIAAGWGLNEAYEYFKNKRQIWLIGVVMLIFLSLSASMINRGYQAAQTMYPLMNDTWYKTLKVIKDNTPPKTILNSWWDFGDWFKVVAGRRVIFDGQSQEKPQAYWMAKALLSNNEREAIGILRMLNNSGNKAFEIIDKYIEDSLESILLLEKIILLEPEEARKYLSDFLPLAAVEEVMKILFYNPARACFIVEDTMIPKMGSISFIGTWDFARVYIAQNFNRQEKDRIIERLVELGRDRNEMQRLYQEVFLITTKNLDDWLSNRLQFYSGFEDGYEKEGTIYFNNGFAYNPEERLVQSNSGKVPVSLFVLDERGFVEVVFSNANVRFSILVVKFDNNYKSILLDRPLANSLFTRLYFLNGAGLKHFQPFINVEEGKGFIKVYNILW